MGNALSINEEISSDNSEIDTLCESVEKSSLPIFENVNMTLTYTKAEDPGNTDPAPEAPIKAVSRPGLT